VTAGSVTSVRDVHQPVFDHLDGLTGGGLFEHALHTLPRRERGYCAGNVTRGLVVLCREPEPRPPARRYRALVLDARRGRSLGQGAESALAMLGTAQQARRISEPE
jgi:hypothetical protein